MSIGGIEAGGTRWTCAVGGEGTELSRVESFATTTPAETIGRAVEFFAAEPGLQALGVGLFGPVVVDPADPRWGTITTTPKPGWRDTPVARPLAEALGVPVALDTDVNAAAVGEWRHGAAQGLDTFVYITVGTGIGGGVFAAGRPVHGLLHPELGHMVVPHDRERDPFEGSCPFHGDCLEGLTAGPAVLGRWGQDASSFSEDVRGGRIEILASYIAQMAYSVILTVGAERFVLGGGVMHSPGLLDAVRAALPDLARGYGPAALSSADPATVLVAPDIADSPGVVGALALAADLL